MRSPSPLIAQTPRVPAKTSDGATRRWWHLDQPSSLLLYPGLRTLDFICGPLVLATVLMARNAHRMPGGMASFLSIRITVKNLALLGIFIAAWWLVFAAFDFYSDRKPRLIKTELASVVWACSLGTALVAVFSVTSASGAFGVNEVIWFWICAVGCLCTSHLFARVLGNLVAVSSK